MINWKDEITYVAIGFGIVLASVLAIIAKATYLASLVQY